MSKNFCNRRVELIFPFFLTNNDWLFSPRLFAEIPVVAGYCLDSFSECRRKYVVSVCIYSRRELQKKLLVIVAYFSPSFKA